MSNEFFNNNPFTPPSAEVNDIEENLSDDTEFLQNPRAVPISNYKKWLGDAWHIFKNRPWLWALMAFIYIICIIIYSHIPFIRWFIDLIRPIIIGGVMYVCDQQRKNVVLKTTHLFEVCRQKALPLLLIGLFPLLITVIWRKILTVLGFAHIYSRHNLNYAIISNGLGISITVAVLSLFLLIAYFLYQAAAWNAPALIMLNNLSTKEALKLGFEAFRKNFIGAIVCAILLFILILLGIIPIGLGLLVTLPLVIISKYTSYRDIFYDKK